MRAGIENVDPADLAVAFIDLPVVEVVRRRDLDDAGPEFGVGPFVGDDGDQPAGEGMRDHCADEMLVARVAGRHRDGGIAEHRLGPGRRHHQMAAAVGERVAEMPEMPLDFARLDFEVGDGRLELRVPVDEPLVAIDEAAAVELDEHEGDGAAEPVVHREAFMRPVDRGAEPAHLRRDGPPRLLFPLPDAVEECIAAEPRPGQPVGGDRALDHHLRRDSGMVGADHPARVAALHPLPADEDVLQRLVQRMADVERAGDIGRWQHDGERRGAGAVGAECAAFLPVAIPAGFDVGRVEDFVEHGGRLADVGGGWNRCRAPSVRWRAGGRSRRYSR